MNFGNMSPKEFGDNFFGPDDERKARCVHCGSEWYEKHYKDGLCHSCQQEDVPGLTERSKKAARKLLFWHIVKIVSAIIVTMLIVKFAC
jgi:hypothetical protein